MSHHIYNTKAFIIDTNPSGETDALVVMYTEDFGLISAIAKGIREMKSKLRYSIQKLSFGTVALVRGREFWRVTNASSEISLFNKGLKSNHRKVLATLLVFVKRFAPGEEKNLDIFEILKQASSFIFHNQKTIEDVHVVESISKLRLMYSLGYIKDVSKNLLTENFTLENIKKWLAKENEINKMVDDAVRISHL